MTNLALALSVFLGTHLLPSIPRLRDRLISRFGKRPYLIGYGLVSTACLVWVIAAAVTAPVVFLWMPSGWQAWITVILSPVALFLILAGAFSVNPLSLSARGSRVNEAGAIVAVTRHPVFWGAALWAGSHIPPNGDTRSLFLFGTLTLLAISGFWLGDKRARRSLGSRWDDLATRTSIVPFAAIVSGRTRLRVDMPMIAAAVASAGLTFWLLSGGHARLFGADPIAATFY
ncbi:NnrU family protein [Pelagibacterium halotolerans]|uniref:NnrU family protein n=1 Tax=Pelagibacterium halotolerans TaxID=531813 RepID=UPI00384BBD62